jgi:hypothetical protein
MRLLLRDNTLHASPTRSRGRTRTSPRPHLPRPLMGAAARTRSPPARYAAATPNAPPSPPRAEAPGHPPHPASTAQLRHPRAAPIGHLHTDKTVPPSPAVRPPAHHRDRQAGCTDARSTQRHTSSRNTRPARPVAVRETADGAHRPSGRAAAVRYTSVDTVTQRSTAPQGDTRRDKEETARIAENIQLAGRFPRVWQVLGSNQRRLSRADGFTDLLS